MNVVVAGAGIAGLSAAWELLQTPADCDVTVVDSERRAGGVILTEQRDGFIVEGGPDGWLASEPDIAGLATELGIAEHIVRQTAHGSSRWTGTALEPLTEGQAAELLGIDVRPGDVAAGFLSFASGMGELVDALVSRVGSRLRTPLGISGITPSRHGWRLSAGGSGIEADAVVLAIPSYGAGRLLEQAGATGARQVGEVVYTPSATVSLAYRADQIEQRLEGTGFVVSPEDVGAQHAAPLHLRAVSYASSKFPGRAPQDHVLLRAFLAPTEDGPADQAHAELSAILGIRGEPLWSRTFYWTKGIPRYPHGHGRHVAALRARLARLPPLAIAGAGYDGAGVSACVRSGRDAAREILKRLAV